MIKKIIIQVLLFCVPIFAAYLITTFKSKINNNVEFFIIVGFIVFLLLTIAVIQILFSVQLQKNIIISDNTIYGECEHNSTKDCCVKEYIKSLKQSDKIRDLVLSNTMLKNYKLISTADMNAKERNFVTQKDNGEIWIFSYDLSSEILGDESQKIVIENIKKGVKYVEFVIYKNETKKDVDKNKNALLQKIPIKYHSNISFKQINESEEVINILPHLLGSVIFIENNNKVQSYFSLRGDGSKKNDPIYFTMPYCMNNEYHEYFNKIKTQ